jgi:hypothetical protein
VYSSKLWRIAISAATGKSLCSQQHTKLRQKIRELLNTKKLADFLGKLFSMILLPLVCSANTWKEASIICTENVFHNIDPLK